MAAAINEVLKSKDKKGAMSAVDQLLSEVKRANGCSRGYVRKQRIKPWEAQRLRQYGEFACRDEDRDEREVQPRKKVKGKKKQTKSSGQDPFRTALAQALSLAKNPRHVIVLSRLYAQTIGASETSDKIEQPIIRESQRDAGKEAKQQLEDLVHEREREYHAALAAATAVTNSGQPDRTASKRLVRAIRRFERARGALNELEANLQRHQAFIPQYRD